MWVFTQNKQTLIDVNEISIHDNNTICGWKVNNEDRVILGVYGSVDRAEEILEVEMIGFKIMYPNGVFRMPKDILDQRR